MRGPADDFDFEMQATVVRRGDAVGEPRRKREIGPRQALLEDPGGTDGAAHFLVVGEMQLDGTRERRAGCLERESA